MENIAGRKQTLLGTIWEEGEEFWLIPLDGFKEMFEGKLLTAKIEAPRMQYLRKRKDFLENDLGLFHDVIFHRMVEDPTHYQQQRQKDELRDVIREIRELEEINSD